MSPSWAERWRIGLAPDGAELLRWPWFGRRRLAPAFRVPCPAGRPDGAPRWEPALAALDEALTQAGARGGAAEVVLSNHFVRYLTVPWQPAVNSTRELDEVVRLRLRTVFGEAADTWVLRCSEGGWGQPSVACAIDCSLMTALRERLAAHHMRLTGLQPLLMVAFNGARRHLGGEAAFAVLEPGRMCLALLAGGGMATVVSRRTGGDAAAVAAQELASLAGTAVPLELALLRVGDAAPWPANAAVAARELSAQPPALAACGIV